MKKKFHLNILIFSVFLVTLFFLLTNNANALWQSTGSKKDQKFASRGPGYETDVAVSNDGTAYIAFEDKNNSKKARVRKFDGTNWVDLADSNNPSGLLSQGWGHKTTLTTKGNEVYAAFYDQTQGNRARVKKWDGSSWSDLSDSSHPSGLISTAKGEEPEIEFDKSENILYATFRDEASGFRIKVMRWRGSSWEEVSDSNHSGGLVSPGQGAEVAIARSKIDDSIYLAYEDVSNGLRLRVMKFDGTNWSDVSNSAHPNGLLTATAAYSPSIAIGPNDEIYIVYTYKKEGKTHILKWNGSSWETLGNGIVVDGKTIESTVEVDSGGNVFVAMSQFKKIGKRKTSWGIRVRKWNGSSWIDISDKSNPKGFLSRKGKGDPSLSFGGGKMFVSFSDYTFGRRARLMFFDPNNI